ncbi:MAG: carbohydrate kinase family protein [Gammaproteobacteria bacterium]|nr:carbohydrate kinase family protein [Gammaproteobacteria bacterium]NKB64918.1 carbohydrate kinase family protein [Gammaproteobacteria bacterium]
MSTLITGSFAYDTIMVFQDQFKNHILPDQVHILNVCFFVPEMRREFGGCSGNIAYNLHLLGDDAVPMGTVGEDFTPYRKRLNKLGMDDSYVKEIPDTYTAQAFLTTDIDNNQIIAFHPGAMNNAHENKVTDANHISLGIVAPDGRDAMIQHSEQFAAANIPFFFDPGQGLPMFDGDDLNRFIEHATYVVVNDYESEMMIDKTGKTLAQISEEVEALIVTRGSKGSEIFHDGKVIHIPAISIGEAVDPTGCGDAFRSGLLYGVNHQWDWEQSGQLASLMGGIKIEHHGTQNHKPTKPEIEARFKENFGSTISL